MPCRFTMVLLFLYLGCCLNSSLPDMFLQASSVCVYVSVCLCVFLYPLSETAIDKKVPLIFTLGELEVERGRQVQRYKDGIIGGCYSNCTWLLSDFAPGGKMLDFLSLIHIHVSQNSLEASCNHWAYITMVVHTECTRTSIDIESN